MQQNLRRNFMHVHPRDYKAGKSHETRTKYEIVPPPPLKRAFIPAGAGAFIFSYPPKFK